MIKDSIQPQASCGEDGGSRFGKIRRDSLTYPLDFTVTEQSLIGITAAELPL